MKKLLLLGAVSEKFHANDDDTGCVLRSGVQVGVVLQQMLKCDGPEMLAASLCSWKGP
jgi:hypothetical protein